MTEPEGTKVEVDVDQELLAEIRDHVLWLTINRPDAGNAITPALRNRMIEHLNDASGLKPGSNINDVVSRRLEAHVDDRKARTN